MKAGTSGPKIDDLKNLIENRKCFDCHEKVTDSPLTNAALGNNLCRHGLRCLRLFKLCWHPQRDFPQSQRHRNVQFQRERVRHPRKERE